LASTVGAEFSQNLGFLGMMGGLRGKFFENLSIHGYAADFFTFPDIFVEFC
jgi:hypothetical protein